VGRIVKISASAYKVMLEHARSTYPDECCGGVLGQSTANHVTVVSSYPCQNTFNGPKDQGCSVGSREVVEAERHAAALGLDVVGWYHSRPNRGAYVSAKDHSHAWPWYSYIVISVREGEVDEVCCYQFQGAGLLWEKEELSVGES